jgi:hypothetical protein
MIGFPLSAIWSGSPMEMDMPQFLLKPLKPVYCYLKDEIPLNKNKNKNTKRSNTKVIYIDWYYF